MISVLVSLRLSLEMREMILASSAMRDFSVLLMMRKFRTMFRFFSSSRMREAMSSESIRSMLMWSNRWFTDTSTFEISSIICLIQYIHPSSSLIIPMPLL